MQYIYVVKVYEYCILLVDFVKLRLYLYECRCLFIIFFFKQKTSYYMRISDWSSDVCSFDLVDKAHAKLTEVKDQYGIKTIMPVQMQHGVYSFYFECLHSSWWEIEYYDGFLHDDFFDFGDSYSDSVLERETTPGS